MHLLTAQKKVDDLLNAFQTPILESSRCPTAANQVKARDIPFFSGQMDLQLRVI
jgi:hypothetical protein